MCWHTLVISEPKGLREEDHEFKVVLGYLARLLSMVWKVGSLQHLQVRRGLETELHGGRRCT